MTPLQMQDELVDEVKTILEQKRFKSPASEFTPVNVYAQDIPLQQTEEDNDPVPYVIVRIQSGHDEGTRESFHTVRVVLVVCCYDAGKGQQGYRDAVNILQMIYQRFARNPDLHRIAYFTGDWEWLVQEADYYPYYFAAATLSFNIAAIRREFMEA